MKPRRILIVDDEPLVAALAIALRTEGFAVRTTGDRAEALRLAAVEQPDLIVLDVGPSAGSGLDVVRELRRTSDVPILALTGELDARDRHAEPDADDYIGKPVRPSEVVARVKTLLHRSLGPIASSRRSSFERIGDLEIDRTGGEARRNGASISLTRTEFRLLDVLTREPGRTFTRSQLIDLVSADAPIFDRTLDRHVANLRKKIGDDPAYPRYVANVLGVGYKFVL